MKTVNEEAHGLIHGDRRAAYGSPLDDFSRTAALLTALFSDILKPGSQFVAEDVPTIQRMVKESRLRSSPRHRDSLVDICGYAGTQEMCWSERERRSHEIDCEIELEHSK